MLFCVRVDLSLDFLFWLLHLYEFNNWARIILNWPHEDLGSDKIKLEIEDDIYNG